MPKLTIQLVTWNGEKYIPYLFESLKAQTFSDWQLIVWDNGSQDETVAAIRTAAKELEVPVTIRAEKENLGFAGGHNKVFTLHDSEYVVFLNQDMYLAPDCVEKVVAALDEQPDVAAVSPRLMRWDFPAVEKSGSADAGKTDDVDALGLKVFRSRRVIEQCTRQSWQDVQSTLQNSQNNAMLAVFGVSGALPLFRRSALEHVAYEDGTVLDETYHSYKEDVDLAFRLVSAGYRARVVLDAVAWHDRSAAGPEVLSDAAAAKNKKKQSSWVRYHSYKNHLMTLYKNEYWQNTLRDLPWIIWYETKKFGWFLLFDRTVLAGLKEVWQHRVLLRKRRKKNKKQRNVSAKDVRQHWVDDRRIERSGGIIPLKHVDGHVQVLLVEQINNDWGFPKGKLEAGENWREAAEREIEEEVELAVTRFVGEKYYTQSYTFQHAGDVIEKTVRYFPALVDGREPETRVREILQADWYTLDAAIEKVTFEQLADMLRDVKQRLEHGEIGV